MSPPTSESRQPAEPFAFSRSVGQILRKLLLNQPNTDYCTKCGAVLNLAKAYEHQAAHTLKDDVVLNLVKLLVQKGLIDDAVDQIHDAGLGATLKRLVDHHEEIQRAKPTPSPAPQAPAAPTAATSSPPPAASGTPDSA